MRGKSVAPPPRPAQKQVVAQPDSGKQDPMVRIDARVEVLWSMGRDKDRKVGDGLARGVSALPESMEGRCY